MYLVLLKFKNDLSKEKKTELDKLFIEASTMEQITLREGDIVYVGEVILNNAFGPLFALEKHSNWFKDEIEECLFADSREFEIEDFLDKKSEQEIDEERCIEIMNLLNELPKTLESCKYKLDWDEAGDITELVSKGNKRYVNIVLEEENQN